MDNKQTSIENIRIASRIIVRELGFMNTTLAATDYPPSSVHALLEIDNIGTLTATQLAEILGLDKSSISRILNKLVKAGEITENYTNKDSRIKQLLLTTKGKHTVNQINTYGQMQVTTALKHLNLAQQRIVAQGLMTYAQALHYRRLGNNEKITHSIEIHSGYRPGIVGRVTEMHAEFYSNHSGFGQFFESQIASGMAEFVSRLNKPCNKIWVAIQNNKIVGSIAIDGQDLGNNCAHLRWFILDDDCRGLGIGRQLLAKAIAFCDKFGFPMTELWTFKGLDAARKLYESFDFQLLHEASGDQWGSIVTEQQFIRYKNKE